MSAYIVVDLSPHVLQIVHGDFVHRLHQTEPEVEIHVVPGHLTLLYECSSSKAWAYGLLN